MQGIVLFPQGLATLWEPCYGSAAFPPQGKASKTTIFRQNLGLHALELPPTGEAVAFGD